jgi:hypothetical protein
MYYIEVFFWYMELCGIIGLLAYLAWDAIR